MLKRLLPLGVALAAMGVAGGTIYKWVDEHGRVHYSETAPPEKKARELEVPPSPSKQTQEEARDKLNRMIEEQQRRQEAWQKQEAEKRSKAAEERAKLEKQCKVARSELLLLTQPGVITLVDKEGNLFRPSDAVRERMIQEQQAFIRENCQ
jgi:Domain of unknown function (DUF4124)